MPRKLPMMTETEINQVIANQFLCRIAFQGRGAPYITPFQYALVEGHLYFHFTNYGKKIGLLREGNPVCVEIEKYTENLNEYRFTLLIGQLKIVTDPQERATAVNTIVKTAKERGLSENFLAAHGFSKDDGWGTLNPDKPLTIVKLVDITEKIGLKSP